MRIQFRIPPWPGETRRRLHHHKIVYLFIKLYFQHTHHCKGWRRKTFDVCYVWPIWIREAIWNQEIWLLRHLKNYISKRLDDVVAPLSGRWEIVFVRALTMLCLCINLKHTLNNWCQVGKTRNLQYLGRILVRTK